MSSKQNKKAMYKQEEDRIIAHSEAFIGLLTSISIFMLNFQNLLRMSW